MTCYSPQQAWRAPGGRVVFVKNSAYVDLPLSLPCGRCIGCRLDKSLEWAIRCVHEASMYKHNSFITLTYDNNHLPMDHGLCLEDFQKFMKRLRKKYGEGIRFYHCGEYGAKLGRPHYHACLFNHDWSDKKLWKRTKSGELLYRSESLEALWPLGFSSTGTVTFQSAAYVSRYIMKKITGPTAENHYEIELPWPGTGEYTLYDRKPEYVTMSRGSKKLETGGIGSEWVKAYAKEIYPHDYIRRDGSRHKPPRFYDTLFASLGQNESDIMDDVRHQRKLSAKTRTEDNTPERLAVREYIQHTRATLLKRELK